jgi:threonine aldolase
VTTPEVLPTVPEVLPTVPESAPETAADEWFRLASSCERILSGNRPVSMRQRLAQLAESEVDLDGRGDAYGGGPVALLEERVAGLLGKPAAVLFPTGTMAQQVALRCWAQRTGNPVVAMHPQSHPEVHERHAYTTLTGLRGVWPPAGGAKPVSAEEIRDLDEPFGTLMLELPLRDPGFLLPSWDELTASVAAARDRGARVHFDGARLWETTHHLGQTLPTIAALADSVYVSFYKTLGGISGAMLVGDDDFIATARAWKHRYGGNVYQQWPAAVAAMRGLDTELSRLPSYVEHARVVAAMLARIPGARVYPAVPHTHQFQLWLPYRAAALRAAVVRLADEEKIWFASGFTDHLPTGYAATEITVASPALALSPADIAYIAEALVARLP